MAKIWHNIKKPGFSRYDVGRLIDSRLRSEFPTGLGAYQIICDIDKTYLETRFESFVDIVQVALESATAKQTVEGASDILIASRWGNIHVPTKTPRNGIHFVSSSPPQLRSVLEEKLMIDGIEWDSDTFKNQAYNILKGRVGFLRQHIAYKSSAILRIMANLHGQKKVVLIGDNAESDPLIYLGITLFCHGIFTVDDYFNYLKLCGLEDALIDSVSTIIPENLDVKVAGIIIRQAPGYKRKIPLFLTNLIRSFEHYYEAGLLLYNIGVIDEDVMVSLTKNFHNYYGTNRSYLCSVLECAALGREKDFESLRQRCLDVLKIDDSVKWNKDVSKDLSPFAFSEIDSIDKHMVFEFAQTWGQEVTK